MAARRPGIKRKAEGAYHHGDLKSALKQAALRLVRQKGPRGFSLNEASRLAGVSVGAPYRHFADKDALLAELACDGYQRMTLELRAAVEAVSDVREKMVAAGMGYLGFAKEHADYFAVMFQAGLDKRKYPEVERSGGEAFRVILELAQGYEDTAALAAQRALACWALVHGLATLGADRALDTDAETGAGAENLQAVLALFLSRPSR